LKWLGHVGRMGEGQLPKKLLFGELRKTRPCHGTKKRWRDQANQDLTSIGAKDNWYQACQNRNGWYELCQGVGKAAARCRENACAANVLSKRESHICNCGRSF